MIDQFGQDGLSAAERLPGLSAAIDQHAAAVRDILQERGGGRGGTTTLTGSASATVRLAAYARALVEQQRRGGGAVPTPRADQWPHADWATLRLLAVCHLGRGVGRGAGGRRPAGA
ncbi:hypothetical protein HF519_21220 [Pseudonocardia bannensis]|uniref:Uncharacterized protein n=1 Tax=Pseudonocardia bannensis TaxID=630973 RepID=A0A848DMN1_9PSEU|nr:hypothetical protein [Pseudonocardia bannensis]